MFNSSIKQKSFLQWMFVFIRLLLFSLFQLFLAFLFLTMGKPNPWKTSAAWWPINVIVVNIFCVALLTKMLHLEGKKYINYFQIEKKTIKKDLFQVLVIMLLISPLGYFPNILLGHLLFGSSQIPLEMYIQPLPNFAIWLSILIFPLTQGLAELPLYFGYAMPFLEQQTRKTWLSILVPSVMLALQHIAVPFLPDIRFILWRFLMFLPFAISLGVVLNKRKHLMPYLVGMHVLMDLSLAPFFLDLL